jgi:DUF4097 and DUF4098 domain-containing protein YvlB
MPGYTPYETYRGARRDTLNFESCGGERHSRDDFVLRPYGQMLYFTAKVAKKVLVRFNREEVDMSNKKKAANIFAEKGDSRAATDEQTRKESFAPTGPVRSKVSTRSGNVTVHTGEGYELEVTLSVRSARDEHLLELAEVRFNAERNYLEIRTQPTKNSASGQRVRVGAKKRWLDLGHSDIDVLVVLPQESSLEVATVSGDTSASGLLDHVTVASVSGDVRVSDSSTTLEVHTASGDVYAGRVLEKLICRSASGDVECLSAATKTEIWSASGDVIVSAERPGEVMVRAVSGDVKVRVARGLAVDVNGRTISGDMGSNIDLDSSSDAKDDEESLYIKVNTVSGDIRIDKAS